MIRLRKLVAAAAAFGVASTAGAAYGYWRTSGSGTGSATAGTLQPLTVSSTSLSRTLLPGTSANVTVSVTNPNAYAVNLTAVSASSITTTTVGCTASHVTFSTGGGFTPTSIPAGGPYNVTITGAVSMDATVESACQGASFTFNLTTTVQK